MPAWPQVLDYIAPFVKPGITTGELDKLCHDYMVQRTRLHSSTIELCAVRLQTLSKSICTSVNHQVCHGVPGDKQLKNGDIVETLTSPRSRMATTVTPAASFMSEKLQYRQSVSARSLSSVYGLGLHKSRQERTLVTLATPFRVTPKNPVTRLCENSVATESEQNFMKTHK